MNRSKQTTIAARALLAVLATAALTGAARADGAAPAPPLKSGETPITPEEWRALVAGRTVYWREYGGFSGREYYAPDGDRVTFIDVQGRCFEGRWAPKPGGPAGVLCFRYRGPGYTGEHCDLHVRRGPSVYARRPSGSVTDVIKTTDEVLSCTPEPTS